MIHAQGVKKIAIEVKYWSSVGAKIVRKEGQNEAGVWTCFNNLLMMIDGYLNLKKIASQTHFDAKIRE